MISDIYNQVENLLGGTMSNLRSALQQLRQEHKHVLQRVETLQSAISVLEDLIAGNGSGASRDGARPGRIVSATARRRMAQAHGAGSKSKVGKGSAGIQASGWESEKCVTREAHDVSIRPPQDCGGSAGAVGEA